MESLKLPNIIEFYTTESNPYLSQFIRGHLYIEFALNKIIEKSFQFPNELETIANTFFRKVKILVSIGRLSKEMETLILAINTIRNILAHGLDYEITFEKAFELVNLAAKAGIDFSDDGIWRNNNYCMDVYGIDGIILELMGNTFYNLFINNEDLFPNEQYLDYMT